jgi:Holliday junction resolvase
MTAYARGAHRERDLVALLRKRGWVANRTAGSNGVADVIALRQVHIPEGRELAYARLIQVKTDKAAPFAHFGPQQRKELIEEARRAGADPVLVWWPGDGKGPRWYFAEDWPQEKAA